MVVPINVAHSPITPVMPCRELNEKQQCSEAKIGVLEELNAMAAIIAPGKIDEAQTAIIEKVNALKQVAHAWEIGGIGYVDNSRIQLNGSIFNFRKIFQQNLQKFSTENDGIISLRETEFLHSLLNEREGNFLTKQDASLLFDDFSKGDPVSVTSGFVGHRVIVAFDKDYLLIANKGMATRKPIEVYKINPEKITAAVFQEIINLIGEPQAIYEKWLSNISCHFDATKDALSLSIEQGYPLSSYQLVGNCPWESLLTCIYGMLTLNRLRDHFERLVPSERTTLINTSAKVFWQWQEFLKIQSLERFFRAHSTSSNPLPYLIANPEEESLDDLVTFEGIDRNFLRNVFRQFWSTKSISIDFKHKMDKLEAQYLKTLSGSALVFAKAEKFYYNQISRVPYIIKDLSTVWAPSVIGTAVTVSYTLPIVRPEFKYALLLFPYSFSIPRTVSLVRRHFAI